MRKERFTSLLEVTVLAAGDVRYREEGYRNDNITREPGGAGDGGVHDATTCASHHH